MSWDINEAIAYYRRQGAPGDQNALRNLLTEIQEESGGAIPRELLGRAAQGLGVKESFLTAIIRRTPRLRLKDVHVLEVCAGPNCSRRGQLAQLAPAGAVPGKGGGEAGALHAPVRQGTQPAL